MRQIFFFKRPERFPSYFGIGETLHENYLYVVSRQVKKGIPGADGRVGPLGPRFGVWGRSERERAVFLVVVEDEEILGLYILKHMNANAIAELKATIEKIQKEEE